MKHTLFRVVTVIFGLIGVILLAMRQPAAATLFLWLPAGVGIGQSIVDLKVNMLFHDGSDC